MLRPARAAKNDAHTTASINKGHRINTNIKNNINSNNNNTKWALSPAAPRRCPVAPFVDDTNNDRLRVSGQERKNGGALELHTNPPTLRRLIRPLILKTRGEVAQKTQIWSAKVPNTNPTLLCVCPVDTVRTVELVLVYLHHVEKQGFCCSRGGCYPPPSTGHSLARRPRPPTPSSYLPWLPDALPQPADRLSNARLLCNHGEKAVDTGYWVHIFVEIGLDTNRYFQCHGHLGGIFRHPRYRGETAREQPNTNVVCQTVVRAPSRCTHFTLARRLARSHALPRRPPAGWTSRGR